VTFRREAALLHHTSTNSPASDRADKEVLVRKILLTVAATCAVLVLAPASALAHGHRGHHRGHHARSHDRTFGAQGTSGSQSQNAGTVESFAGGVLTITLANGSTVSGQVTDATRIVCQAAQPAGMQSSERTWGDNGGAGAGGGDQGQGDDDQGQGDDDQSAQSCNTTSLATGAPVREAVLRLSGAGAVWDVVVLATPPSSSTSPTSSSS
jgi:hypothetical protein